MGDFKKLRPPALVSPFAFGFFQSQMSNFSPIPPRACLKAKPAFGSEPPPALLAPSPPPAPIFSCAVRPHLFFFSRRVCSFFSKVFSLSALSQGPACDRQFLPFSISSVKRRSLCNPNFQVLFTNSFSDNVSIKALPRGTYALAHNPLQRSPLTLMRAMFSSDSPLIENSSTCFPSSALV